MIKLSRPTSSKDNGVDGVLAELRQEFIDSARDQIDDIDTKLDGLDSGQGKADEELTSIQRHIHNIKGQGGTFGFPITGRVAHMLEDYLINADGIQAGNISDIRAYLSLMMNLISTGESIAVDGPQRLLNDLPTGQIVTFSTQRTHDINVLLVMPPGLQRKLVAKELLSCGFRVMRAYDSIEALSVAMDIIPDIVFANYDMGPFDGRELSKVFADLEKLRDVHFVLLTSYETGNENLQDLPDGVSVIQKHKDFSESIGELLIQWGVFGNIPHKPTETSQAISRHPKTAKVVRFTTQRPLKILLAEDNPINQQLIKATVEAFGHQLEVANNGLLAVDAVTGEDFDLILMDVRMPEMGGLEATQTIRQLSNDKSKIPIVAVTSDGLEEHRKSYFEAGMDACVTKPIDRADLLDAINKVMKEKIHVGIEVEVDESAEESPEATTGSRQDDGPKVHDGALQDFMKQLQDVEKKYEKT